MQVRPFSQSYVCRASELDSALIRNGAVSSRLAVLRSWSKFVFTSAFSLRERGSSMCFLCVKCLPASLSTNVRNPQWWEICWKIKRKSRNKFDLEILSQKTICCDHQLAFHDRNFSVHVVMFTHWRIYCVEGKCVKLCTQWCFTHWRIYCVEENFVRFCT